VYFERSTESFAPDALPRAKAAQLKLEHYYKVAVDAAVERNARFVRLFSPSMHSSSERLDELNWSDGFKETLCCPMNGSIDNYRPLERRSLRSSD